MTHAEAKALIHGQVIYDLANRNAKGENWRWKVNGKVTTWKRSPKRIRIPIKRGLYQYGYVTEQNLEQFSLTPDTLVG